MEDPQITGGELDADSDTDADPNVLLARPQSYVANQDALVAAIVAELTAQGATKAFINEAIPYAKTFVATLASVAIPGSAAAVTKVLGAVPNAI